MASLRQCALFCFAAAAVTAVVAAAACSSFTDDGATDAGTETGALDATAADAGGDARPGSFCASHPDAGLCADFDQGNPVTFHFTLGSGNIKVDGATTVSPPAAMLVTAGPDNASAWVEGNAIGAAFASRQRFAFDTYQGTFGGDGGTEAGITRDAIIASLGHAVPGCTFDIESFGDRARLNIVYPDGDGGSAYTSIDLTAFPPARTWAHVEMLLEQTPGAVVASVKVNDFVALARRPTKCPALAADPGMKIGLLLPGGVSSLTGEARYDNVLVVAE